MHEHLAQPARREADNAIVEKKLWDRNDSSSNGMYEVNFRIGDCGRFVWEQDEESCYIQYLPPYVENMQVSPRMLKTMMDYSGINAAVLQCGGTYGKLNKYYEKIMEENSWAQNTFFPLARIDEESSYTAATQKELEKALSNKFLKGLWFAGKPEHFSPKYDPFWRLVRQLSVPVFLLFYPDENWAVNLKGMGRWAGQFADIRCVLAQAFPLAAHRYDASLSIPEYAKTIIQECDFLVEIVYPIGRGAIEEYPFPVSIRAVRELYQTFGAKKLVWGSDIPMVERYCTYSQSLGYFLKHCDFIPDSDKELIVGGNLKRIFFRE